MKLLDWIQKRLFNPPQFDFWFWILLIWTFVVPYLFDNGHVKSCLETGRVHFTTIDHFLDEKEQTFNCAPIHS